MWYFSDFQNYNEFVCVQKRMALVRHILTQIHPKPCKILVRKNIFFEENPERSTAGENTSEEAEQQKCMRNAIDYLFSPENLRFLSDEDISYRQWAGDFGTETFRIIGWYEIMDPAHLTDLFDLDPMSEFVFTEEVDNLSSYICQINYFDRFQFGVAIEISEKHKNLVVPINSFIKLHYSL